MKAVKRRSRILQIVTRILAIFLLAVALLAVHCYAGREVDLLTTRYVIKTPKLKEGTSFRLVSLSDYHNHGLEYRNETLLEAIEKENPNAVMMTGDMIDSHTSKKDLETLDKLASFLEEKAFPTYFVSGNHEESAPKEIKEASYSIYRKRGIAIVTGETGPIFLYSDGSSRVALFGFEDPGLYDEDKTGLKEGSKIYRQAEKMHLDEGDYNLLLSHEPCYFEAAKKKGFDLTLSGHTHAGQISLFNYPLLSWPWTKYERGSYTEKDHRLLISNGLGDSYHLPFRYHCPYSLLSVTIVGTGH